jgi:hypothetical protein
VEVVAVAGESRPLTSASAARLIGDTATQPLADLGLNRRRAAHYVRQLADVVQTVEILAEPGGGNTCRVRIHWGVTPTAGLSALFEHWEDLKGAEHAALNGDLGSLALRRKPHLWLTVSQAPSRFGLRRTSTVEEAGRRFAGLVKEHLLPVLEQTSSLVAAGAWLERNGSLLNSTGTWPWTDEMQSRTAVAFAILTGERDRARTLLQQWRSTWAEDEARARQYALFRRTIDGC